MKLISWWGCGKIDQPLISGDKIVEFGIADPHLQQSQIIKNLLKFRVGNLTFRRLPP
jgi:hypothetical protein